MKYFIYALFAIIILLSAKSDKKYYDELYRPQFHFSPEKNWLFEPNGFVFYQGEYHLFYHNVLVSNKIFTDQLGHAVSKDLVHWKHLPFAFTPNENANNLTSTPPTAGSAVVDSMNVSGLQQKDEKPMLIFYSDNSGNQNLAISKDKGFTWIKYDKNPIIAVAGGEARDPKVFYHAQSGKWTMALYQNSGDSTKAPGISFYSSSDLLNWKFSSHLEGFGECPDIFELALDGNSAGKKWVVLSGDGDYMIGSFDGLVFKSETAMLKLDFGKNFYAAQTLSNSPNGKVIQIAWMRGGEFTDMAFNGQMSFPTELTLRTTKKGIVLCRKPVESISTLYDKEIKKKDKNFIPGLKGSLVGGIKGDAIFIKAVFLPKTSDSFGFLIRTGKKSEGTEIKYDTAKKILEVNGLKMPLEPIEGKIEMQLLIDRSSIEVFANHGELGISTCFSPVQGEEELILYTQGGELYLESLEAYNLKTTWQNK